MRIQETLKTFSLLALFLTTYCLTPTVAAEAQKASGKTRSVISHCFNNEDSTHSEEEVKKLKESIQEDFLFLMDILNQEKLHLHRWTTNTISFTTGGYYPLEKSILLDEHRLTFSDAGGDGGILPNLSVFDFSEGGKLKSFSGIFDPERQKRTVLNSRECIDQFLEPEQIKKLERAYEQSNNMLNKVKEEYSKWFKNVRNDFKFNLK